MGGVEVDRVVRAGEPTDVIILAAKAMEQLKAEGYFAPGTRGICTLRHGHRNANGRAAPGHRRVKPPSST